MYRFTGFHVLPPEDGVEEEALYEGVVFNSGTVVVQWFLERSTSIYPSWNVFDPNKVARVYWHDTGEEQT